MIDVSKFTDEGEEQRRRDAQMDSAQPSDSADNASLDDSGVDRLSLGQRIGAKDRVAPVQLAQPSADNQPQPPSIKFDPQNIPAGIFAGTTTPRMPPEAPVGSKNPNLVDLLRQQADYGKPLDRKAVDPNTGKPIYKMGWGQRVLGTVANFASGFGGKGPVAYVGPGATNRRYDIDESTREANLANVNTQIKSQEQLDAENIKQEREATRQSYEGQVGAARQETAAAQTANAATRNELAQTQEQLNQARANKTAANPIDQRIADANKIGLKGEDRKYYIANGKLKEPSPLDDIRQELARQRLDDAKQARVDKVQKDAEAEMTAHKNGIQKRIDALDAKVELGELDKASPEYKQKIAQIERDDYAGMGKVGNGLATRLKGFGVSVTPPAPRPWEQSNLSDDERAKLLGTVGARSQGTRPTAARSTSGNPSPATHTFSLSAWKKANPSGNADAAKTAAQKAGYRVAQ